MDWISLFLLIVLILILCATFIVAYFLWQPGELYVSGSLLFLFVLGHLIQRGGL
jgi:hypothetical protein